MIISLTRHKAELDKIKAQADTAQYLIRSIRKPNPLKTRRSATDLFL